MDVTAPGGLERLGAAAAGVRSTPVVQVGGKVFLGFDRGKLSRELGIA
ncbi:MAG: hypothetical protein L0216_11310 [Planctomycetales bacterium]|nr:hypothetical protein [Planctomycetales bacterium]